ncbi:pyridoxamine 5'-phosphate oxidase family protein [Rhizobium miluonense]|uniref:Nitroimidazol reductase NimA-like FMN-containing flavoprotein (Pyridoxamine 5'-phosphate oxidase superfamily) n=1 Tax=Rhizobium miluonense TaxID=411945 RepID=A0ABU1SXN2_9HYPH|nr:pyridoxamine 5'-phosphate oxidase family protein [Rhizobium miluonense]MDR6903707.1 nitroimidazol reductase NimA-like FMN-containing flavoprotein (pyridoxamine 5'-phosphate oxidase superfamily) [Rhizobium miluonense]
MGSAELFEVESMNVQEMSYDECIALVKKEWLARLACADGNVPYVVPVQYACADDKLYVFTLPGKKLTIMRRNPRVCLQIDRLKSKHSWKSVVIDARFTDLSAGESREERDLAWSLLAGHTDWWEPGALKPIAKLADNPLSTHVFFALEIVDVSGRKTQS